MKTKMTLSFILSVAVSGCFFSCSLPKDKPASVETIEADNHIEVIYFHSNMRCSTCRAIEKYAKETVDSLFPNETESGMIVFRSINVVDNEAIADNYQTTGSSLFVTSFVDGSESRIDMTEYAFKTARRHREMFQDSLATVIRNSFNIIKP